MDIGVHLYVPVRESLLGLMSEVGTLLFVTIGLLGFWVARQHTDRPFVVILALAAIGAFAAFLVQGKGWLYQALPALMFLTMAAGFAMDPLVRSPRELLFCALAMIMATLGIMGFNQLGLPILAATIAAAWLCRVASPGIFRAKCRGSRCSRALGSSRRLARFAVSACALVLRQTGWRPRSVSSDRIQQSWA